MPAINPSVKLSVEKWLAENEPKLRQYAFALAARDTGKFFDEGDFFNAMSMKIYTQALMTKGFIEMPTPYLLKVIWNEGLMMLRRQRRYSMFVEIMPCPIDTYEPYSKIFFSRPGTDQSMDRFPGPDSDCPENAKIIMDNADLIAKAIASLPEKSRKIVTMLYAGKRPVEIAQAFGWKGQHSIPTYYMNQIRDTFRQVGLQTV